MAREPLRLVHGTSAQVAAYTGPSRELVYNDDTAAIHVQDGATPGGRAIARKDEIALLPLATSALVASPKSRTIAARALDDEILLTDGASVIDGAADCLVGINNAIAAAAGRILVIPPGRFPFSAPLNPITANYTQIRGHGRKSHLQPTYAAGDILTLGNGTTQVLGVNLRDFFVWPSGPMTSGHAVNSRLGSRVMLRDVFLGSADDWTADGPRLKDGVYFDRFSECSLYGGAITCSGKYIKARGNADQSFGAELDIGGNLRVIGGQGAVVGGACGGVYFGRLDVSGADIGVLIDGSLQPGAINREVFFSSQCTIDASNVAAVKLAQIASGATQIQISDGWYSSTKLGGPGIWIASGPNARATVGGKIYNNTGDGLRIDANDIYVHVTGEAFFDLNTGWGINPTVATSNLTLGGSPKFLANTLGEFNTANMRRPALKSGAVVITGSPTTGWDIDRSGSLFTLAQGASIDLAVGSGLVVLNNTTVGSTALFIVGGGGCIALGQSTTTWTNVNPGAGQVGLYWTGSGYRLTNNTGATITVGAALVKINTGL